jgi:hypothetical protein
MQSSDHSAKLWEYGLPPIPPTLVKGEGKGVVRAKVSPVHLNDKDVFMNIETR